MYPSIYKQMLDVHYQNSLFDLKRKKSAKKPVTQELQQTFLFVSLSNNENIFNEKYSADTILKFYYSVRSSGRNFHTRPVSLPSSLSIVQSLFFL